MLRGRLGFFISVTVLLSLAFARLEARSQCASLIAGIHEASPDDWAHKDRSLPSVVANSVLWLSAAESTRILGDAEAFGSAFAANTAIDVVLTAISHQISMGNVPKSFQKYFEGKQSYKRRAVVNTTIAMAVLLPIWTLTAASSGTDISEVQAWLDGEVIHPAGPVMALGLFYSAYRFAPYFKNWLFQSRPQRADAQNWAELQSQFPNETQSIESAARQRAAELELDTAAFENLVMSMVEVVRLRLPYEDRISNELLAERAISSLVDKILNATDEDKPKLRKKLVAKLLKLYDSGAYQREIERTLSLGEPFNETSSLEVQRTLNKRNWKMKVRTAVSAFFDQSLWVGFLGGVVLRGITGFSLGV